MSLEALQERLVALQETTSQLRELIDRLANLKFQPGSVPLGTDEENSVSGELSAEIGQMLRGGVEDQELLQEEVNYLRREVHEKGRLKDGVEKVGQELTSYRIAFRKARLSAKKSLIDAQKLERQLIMKSYSQPVHGPDSADAAEDAPVQPIQRFVRQQQQYSSLSEEDQQTVGASNNVTNALRRTHDLIASELSRSEFAHETLVESSAALKQLNESYGSLDTMLASSRDLLGTLVRSQKSDTWYLQTAMYMLMVTGAWLVFRRLLYGPIWWLVLFPLRILFGVGSAATKAVLPRGSAPNQSGKVDVGDNEATEVKGIPKEVPTVKGGTEKFTDAVQDEVKKAVESAVNGESTEEPLEVEDKAEEAEAVHERDEL